MELVAEPPGLASVGTVERAPVFPDFLLLRMKNPAMNALIPRMTRTIITMMIIIIKVLEEDSSFVLVREIGNLHKDPKLPKPM